MLRDGTGDPGLTVVWPAGAPPPRALPPGASAGDGITRRLDLAQARLDALEASLATLAPHLPLNNQQAQDLHELHLLLADLTAELLGADHPLVAPLREARRSHPGLREEVTPAGVVTPAARARGSWLGGRRGHPLVQRLLSRLSQLTLPSLRY
jgi:hypothetical protein